MAQNGFDSLKSLSVIEEEGNFSTLLLHLRRRNQNIIIIIYPFYGF